MENDFFKLALATVLKHEGGFVDDPVDPGGATNFGISLRFLRAEIERSAELSLAEFDIDADGDLDAADMEGLTRDQAAELYRSAFWDRHKYGEISAAAIAIKVFDLAVNMGPRQAHKLLQRAIRAARGNPLADDGVLGPKTWGALISATLTPDDTHALLAALRSEAAGFYRALIAQKPRFVKYRGGWLSRAYA